MIAPMLETEAKQKLCCGPEGCGLTIHQYQQIGGAVGGGVEQQPVRPLMMAKRLCAGSLCMAWIASASILELPSHQTPEGEGWSKSNKPYPTADRGEMQQWKRMDKGSCGWLVVRETP